MGKHGKWICLEAIRNRYGRARHTHKGTSWDEFLLDIRYERKAKSSRQTMVAGRTRRWTRLALKN
ncbi:hypothetical protein [Nitrosospira briensis]|uniref:hypothetical protein n=1 Tax=Nitrosospira briensis TaxID=35799 RepID=UPI00116065FA|nr:hypothetical protein [Nitrosospira briensis]